MEASELECCLTVESLNANGIVTKRRTYKNITVVIGRDEFRDIALRIVSTKSPLGKTFLLKEISIHKRFLQEGKATIKLLKQKLQLMISNCPPNQLGAFLKCLSLKLAQSKQTGLASNRRRLLSEKPRSFENVSPLTDKDFTSPTGCKKRPLDENNGRTPKRIKTGKEYLAGDVDGINNGAPRRRLNCLSSFQTNFTAEQMAVLNAVKSGRSVFFTGSAGTGKSYLLKRLITMLPPQSTFVTASTGAAACHIGGTTLHAFAGIGSGSAPLTQCIELALRPGRAQQWRRCKHLIIDEISMVDSNFFDKLEAVARAVRKKEIPFGGIQLILSGDFLQLPPVVKQAEKKKFCFQADCWNDCVHTTTELKKVYRQKDPLFISILQNVRVGSCPDALVQKLNNTKNQVIEQEGILATKLCTHKENVNQINEIHLSRLPGEKRVFQAMDSDSSMCTMLDSQVPVGQTLELKEGAQVMLAKNLNVSKGLVNGARGIIKRFDSGSAGYPVVKFMYGSEQVIGPEKWVVKTAGWGTVTRRQLPLKLAWAVSIHKSQGMTLDCVEISLSRVFEYGQAYVALSRARSLQGLRVLDFDSKCVRAHPDVLRYYARLQRDTKLMQCNFQNEDKENICPS